jgi:uncharacterized membrane protein
MPDEVSSASARLPKVLFLLLAVGAWIYFYHYYPLLPKVVASHFDQHGLANGWQTKQSFFEIFAGLTALSAFLVFGVPTVIAVMPRQLINLPNKEYWLSPQQWVPSMEFLDAWFAWFGCAVYFLIVVTYDYAIQTNLHSTPNFARIWYALTLFAVFAVVWMLRLFRRFSRLPRAQA